MHRAKRANTIDPHSAPANRQRRLLHIITGVFLTGVLIIGLSGSGKKAEAQSGPSMTDPNLLVTNLLTGLVTPISIAFPAPNQLFVLEKYTGQVKYLANGSLTTVLDLAVNNA